MSYYFPSTEYAVARTYCRTKIITRRHSYIEVIQGTTWPNNQNRQFLIHMCWQAPFGYNFDIWSNAHSAQGLAKTTSVQFEMNEWCGLDSEGSIQVRHQFSEYNESLVAGPTCCTSCTSCTKCDTSMFNGIGWSCRPVTTVMRTYNKVHCRSSHDCSAQLSIYNSTQDDSLNESEQ